MFDPTGGGDWSVTGSVAKYVSAISNSIADASSAGGNPQTRQFVYRGPNINPAGTAIPVTSDVAIRQLFDWYIANGGANLPLTGPPTIPGVSPIIGELSSPNSWEYALGVNRQFEPARGRPRRHDLPRPTATSMRTSPRLARARRTPKDAPTTWSRSATTTTSRSASMPA